MGQHLPERCVIQVESKRVCVRIPSTVYIGPQKVLYGCPYVKLLMGRLGYKELQCTHRNPLLCLPRVMLRLKPNIKRHGCGKECGNCGPCGPINLQQKALRYRLHYERPSPLFGRNCAIAPLDSSPQSAAASIPPGASPMSTPMTSRGTRSATSSQESEAGPLQLDLLGGPAIKRSGREARPAGRSSSPAREKARMTIGNRGPTFSDSSAPAGPLCSWESRLRQRLAGHSSMECWLTWKASTTPAGRSLSRPVPSTPPPARPPYGFWPTPTTRDHKDSLSMSFAPQKNGASRLDLLRGRCSGSLGKRGCGRRRQP